MSSAAAENLKGAVGPSCRFGELGTPSRRSELQVNARVRRGNDSVDS